MNPRKLVGLQLSDYQHPLDEKSLSTLKNTRGIDKVVNRFYDMGIEKVIKLQHTGSSLELSVRAFPQLHMILHKACDVLEVSDVPRLYVERSDQFTTVTHGVDQPMIVMSSEMLDKFTPDELLFMFGREIAKIKSSHILYQEIGYIFPEMMEAMSALTLGLSSILSTGLKYALFNWAQKAEYTADRGGLLVCQDVYLVKQVYAKLAGLPEKYWAHFPIESLESQAEGFEGFTEKNFDKFVRFLHGNNLWAIARAHELFKWIQSGAYVQIMGRKSVAAG
jgi:Zn-dependent protease with chaperone function